MTPRGASTTGNYPYHQHRLHNEGWIRAAVLGANDGILSTTSLLIGVSAAGAGTQEIVIAGVSALVAGAMSMACGEYVSVSSQADMEAAELKVEQEALERYPDEEHAELRDIYIARGLTPALATEVARQLSEHDALQAHVRDDLGLTAINKAQPLVAAFASAVTFAAGAALPLLSLLVLPVSMRQGGLAVGGLLFLILLGAIAARSGGASMTRGALRVGFWGTLAMSLSFVVGRLFGVVV
jgi:VIT1/CCC1 family predicted Fe2+/Mn2+ transporter